jgi:hypothetical protein
MILRNDYYVDDQKDLDDYIKKCLALKDKLNETGYLNIIKLEHNTIKVLCSFN